MAKEFCLDGRGNKDSVGWDSPESVNIQIPSWVPVRSWRAMVRRSIRTRAY
jgi:hypothetical protein